MTAVDLIVSGGTVLTVDDHGIDEAAALGRMVELRRAHRVDGKSS